jgi:hypothetical protein
LTSFSVSEEVLKKSIEFPLPEILELQVFKMGSGISPVSLVKNENAGPTT